MVLVYVQSVIMVGLYNNLEMTFRAFTKTSYMHDPKAQKALYPNPQEDGK